MILTNNEKCVLRLLAANVGKDTSMNDIGRGCSVSPAGAHKILTKLEKEGILKAKQIANIKSYSLDFSSEKTQRVLELAFMPDALEARVKLRADDLAPLKKATKACILFGSYITPKKTPGDLDVLFVLEKTSFEQYKKALAKAQDITPVKIQDVVQTSEDFEKNLKKQDPIIIAAIRTGIVLWGFDLLVQIIRKCH